MTTNKLNEEQTASIEEEDVTPAMIAAGWACLKRAHLPHLGPGPGLVEAYRAMRAVSRKP